MKLAIIMPDRNDRPLFLENCLRMIKAQTFQPDIIELVNDKPLTNECDITWRYRTGYDRLRNKGIDVIALMENDDWYAPNYLQKMVTEWIKKGKPDLLGTNYTIYYHIKLFEHLTMWHDTRSSAMSTLIKPDLNFEWCADNEPYTDSYLWNTLKGITFNPGKNICLGIKHGTGMCGGLMHTERLDRYQRRGQSDHSKEFLKQNMDAESFEFYANYIKKTGENNSPAL